MEYMELLIGFALGWYLGGKWVTLVTVKAMMDIFRELKITNADLRRIARENGMDLTPEEPSEDPDLEQIEIKVEKHGDMLYAFRKDNDLFLGQGTSRDDLIKAMAERLRNVRCTVVEGNEYMKPEEA